MQFKKVELILMVLFFALCLWANKSQAAPSEATPVAEKAAVSPIMGFKSWKSLRVDTANKALVDFRVEQEATDNSGQPLKTGKYKNMNPGDVLRQLEFNLEIAKGLTIHDYFALYLKDKSPDQLTEIVKMLSPDELSALLVAYRKQLFNPDSGEKAPVAPAGQPL